MKLSLPSRLSHANRGRGLESLVETSQTTVRLSKVPHGVRHIGGGKTVAIRGLPDYFGIYVPTRRLIVFDCKMSAEPHHLPTNDRVFPEHQRQTLWMYADAGAISGILAMRTAAEELYWVPFPMLVTHKPSIPWASMVPIGSAKFAIRWERIASAPASGVRGVEA